MLLTVALTTRRMKLLFLALTVLLVLILFFHSKWGMLAPITSVCLLQVEQTNIESTFRDLPTPLGDVLLTAPKPTPGRSIFFLETSCIANPSFSRNMLRLTARQACAIESAALHNPNFQVFVLFASPRYQHQDNSSGSAEPLVDAILSYPNVQLRRLNLMRYAAGTPVEDWVKGGQLFLSSYPIAHLSDLLRMITLYHFGGIYLDMDVVLLRSLEQVPPNYAGAESDTHVAIGIISLTPTGFGHEFASSYLNDFQENFNGNDWGHNGPGVMTRVAQRICGTSNITMMLENRKGCQGFKVFDRKAFYAVGWMDWRHFFEPEFLEQTLERTKDSYLIHVWNKHSQQRLIKVGSGNASAYGKIAEHNCPRSYAAAGEYF